MLMQHAIEEHESRNAHVGGAVDEHRSLTERLHHLTEKLEIARRRGLEIHRDVDIGHPQTGNEAAFIRQRIIRRRQRKIYDRFETSLTDRAKLRLCRLAGSAEPLADGAEVVNPE